MTTRRVNHWITFLDLIWSVPAFLGAYSLRYRALWLDIHRPEMQALLPLLAATVFLWMFLSMTMKLDGFRGGWRFQAMASQLFLAVLCLMCVLLSVGYLRREYVSRLALTYFGVLLLVGFIGIRYVARILLRAKYHAGHVRRVVIVGSDRIARELGVKISRHPEMLCKVVGFLCPEDAPTLGNEQCGTGIAVPPLGVVDLLATHRVTDIIFAVPKPSLPEILNLAGGCRERRINVSFVPQPYELYLSKPSLLDLDGIPILELREASASDLFFRWKRLADILFSLALSLLAVPILLPAALEVRRAKGKAFRREARCGQYGKTFFMLRLNIDRGNISATRFERLLETLSITELPQFWNVLRGDMSLVGPRPEALDRVKRYSEWQQQRLSTKPGMTGLAQVHGLREQSSSEEKTRFDLQYILHPSAVSDISILMQTVWTLATRCLLYRRLKAEHPKPCESRLLDTITPSFIEETLQVAHRSQSSAD